MRASRIKPRYLIAGGISLAATVTVLLLIAASAPRVVGEASWRLSDLSADGQTLTLQVPLAGVASNCSGVDHVDVSESSDNVKITAFTWVDNPLEGEVCTSDLALQGVDAHLARPLGRRLLLGCSGSTPETSVGEENSKCRDQARRAFPFDDHG